MHCLNITVHLLDLDSKCFWNTYFAHYILLTNTATLKTVRLSESEVAQLCPTLCNPMDCSLMFMAPLSMGFSRQDTGVHCHFLLQWIFPTQGSNLGLLHCRQMLLLSEPPGKSKDHLSLYWIMWITSHISVNMCRVRFNSLLISGWKVAAEPWKTPGFLASRGEESNLGPDTRLDHSELLCNKVLLKYKRDRESL